MLKIPCSCCSKCYIVPSALPWCPLPDGTHGLLSWWGWEVFVIIHYHLIISSTEHCRSNKMINRIKSWYIIHIKIIKMIILMQAKLKNCSHHCRPIFSRQSYFDRQAKLKNCNLIAGQWQEGCHGEMIACSHRRAVQYYFWWAFVE